MVAKMIEVCMHELRWAGGQMLRHLIELAETFRLHRLPEDMTAIQWEDGETRRRE